MTWQRTAGATAAARPEQVWRVLLDGRRWSQWNPGVEWMTLEGPPEPGTVLTMKPKGAPQTAFRVEAASPNALLGLVVTFGPLASMRFRWDLAPVAAGTSIVQTVAIGGPLAGLLLRRAAERIAGGMGDNLERLAARSAEAAGPHEK
jgi:uncharacterized protein YndB with AHSA1/START domain